MGIQFPWKRPRTCPECGSTRLWGHGFVLRHFFGINAGILLKRWRCPDCHAIHSCRPVAYLPRMHYPCNIQIKSLENRLEGRPFPATVSRQVQQHWWKAFHFKCRQAGNWNDPGAFYRQCRLEGQLPVTKQRIYRARWPSAIPPYLPFAVTVKKRPHILV